MIFDARCLGILKWCIVGCPFSVLLVKGHKRFQSENSSLGRQIMPIIWLVTGFRLHFILPYYLDNVIHTLTYQASESNMANNSHVEGEKMTIFFSKSHWVALWVCAMTYIWLKLRNLQDLIFPLFLCNGSVMSKFKNPIFIGDIWISDSDQYFYQSR